jgi:predicted DNA-binding transcriptional regulator AlpA
MAPALNPEESSMPKSRTQFAPVPPPPTPRLALSIREFCEAHSISQALFFKLKRQGGGPRELKLGSRTLITFESAAEWRRAREAKHTEQPVNRREQSDEMVEKKNSRERAFPRPGCNHSGKRG